MNVLRPTKVITLHAKKLNIFNVSIEDFATDYSHELVYDFLHVFTTDDVIQPGNRTVRVSYEGLLGNGQIGLYSESYCNISTGKAE